MENKKENITLEQLLQTLDKDFDSKERDRILDILKHSNPTDSALLGAKLLLEDNHWDYKVLSEVFNKTNQRIDNTVKRRSETNYAMELLKYAAVLLPIIGIIGYFIFYSAPSLDEYYVKEEGLMHVMDDKKTEEWDVLMELYSEGDFKNAYKHSERTLNKKPLNDTAHYYHAVIAYELKQYAVSQEYFEKVSKNENSVFKEESEFRLGFCLHKQNQKQASREQFEKVKNNSLNPYNEDAGIILKEIF